MIVAIESMIFSYTSGSSCFNDLKPNPRRSDRSSHISRAASMPGVLFSVLRVTADGAFDDGHRGPPLYSRGKYLRNVRYALPSAPPSASSPRSD